MKNLLIAFIFATMLTVFGNCQVFDIPDAPSALSDRNPAEVAYSQEQKCGSWKCWNYPNVPTKQVFKSKAYWAFVGTDLSASTFDASMSYKYQGGNCVEGGEGLGLRPSFGALMRHNLPENAAAAIVGFVWIKVKGPKWVMPLMLAAPVEEHIRAGLAWRHC